MGLPAPRRRIFAGVQQDLGRAIELLRPEGAEIASRWKGLVRLLAPGREQFEALSRFGAGLGMERMRGADLEAYLAGVREGGELLIRGGVPADQAIAAVALYLESALRRIVERGRGPDPRLALIRLTAAIQRQLLRRYAETRAAGSHHLDDQERLRLSRDLHDEIGADLVVLKLCIEMIVADLRRGQVERVASKLEEALALVAHAVESVRRLTLDLAPALLEQFGLIAAVRLFCRKFASRTGIDVTVGEATVPERIPAGHQTALYRVLQGALSNVVKHARARNVKVALGDVRGRVLVMVMEDDGVGFDSLSRPPTGSFGIAAMRERVENLGGRLYVESRPVRKRGTRIEVDLPIRGHAG